MSHFIDDGHLCYGDWTQTNGTWNNEARACKGDGGAPIFHVQTKARDRPEKCKDLFQDPPDPKCEQYHRVSFNLIRYMDFLYSVTTTQRCAFQLIRLVLSNCGHFCVAIEVHYDIRNLDVKN